MLFFYEEVCYLQLAIFSTYNEENGVMMCECHDAFIVGVRHDHACMISIGGT
jgi:hypothetical protein